LISTGLDRNLFPRSGSWYTKRPYWGSQGVCVVTGQGRRRDEWSYQGADEGAQGRSGWDEVPSGDPDYDPSAPNPARYWDNATGGSQGNPYDHQYVDPRYSYQPPPQAYAQYPPPIYANPYVYPMPYGRPPNPSNAVAGGLLCIVSGCIGVLWMVFMTGSIGGLTFAEGMACIIIPIVLSLMAVLGGIMAMKKRMFPLAVMGAICATLNGTVFGLNIILGIIALVLIISSKDVFTPSTMQPPNPYRY